MERNDLVNRSALLEILQNAKLPGYFDCAEAVFWMIDKIETATAVDAELVRHGRWESECEPNYKCSCCEHYFHLYQPMNYCPNCGAKMVAEVAE